MVNRFLCVNVGDVYSPEYVHRLYYGIKRNIPWEYPRLTLVTDQPGGYPTYATIDARNFMEDGVPPHTHPGRWGRTMIFSPTAAKVLPNEPHLYVDIDNVILSDLTPLLEQIQGHEFSAHRPWRESVAATGLAASVMGVTPGSEASAAIWDYYWRNKDTYREQLTQNLYRYALEEAGLYDKVNWLSRKQVASYKWLAGLSRPTPAWLGTEEEAIVLCCHGTPKPPEIIDQKLPGWETVKEAWR